MPAPRRNPDALASAGSLVSLGLFAAGGLWLLSPEQDGTSRLQKLVTGWRGVQNTLSGIGGGGTNGGGSTPQTPPGGQGAPPAANTGSNQFDFGDSSWLLGRNLVQQWNGHIVVVHLGPGGTFRVTAETRALGLFNLANSDWITILDQQITVGNDTDWISYSVDFADVPGLVAGTSWQLQARATVWGLSNEWYVTRNLPTQFGGL